MPEDTLEHGRAELAASSSEIFVGDVSNAPLDVAVAMPTGTRTLLVRFDPGAHTKLHVHDGDQVLIITEGRGHVGTPEVDREVVPGDVVRIPAGTPHYHGAAAGEAMAHVAMLAGGTAILSDVAWPPVAVAPAGRVAPGAGGDSEGGS